MSEPSHKELLTQVVETKASQILNERIINREIHAYERLMPAATHVVKIYYKGEPMPPIYRRTLFAAEKDAKKALRDLMGWDVAGVGMDGWQRHYRNTNSYTYRDRYYTHTQIPGLELTEKELGSKVERKIREHIYSQFEFRSIPIAAVIDEVIANFV